MLNSKAMCFTLSTSGIGDIGSAGSSMNMHMDLHTACFNSTFITDDDSDWLHRNDNFMRDKRNLQKVQNVPTSVLGQEQCSFIARSAHEENKRQRDSSEQTRQRKRERYSLMPDEQRDVRLHKNREYKKMHTSKQDNVCP